MIDGTGPAPRDGGNRAGIRHADQRSDTAPAQLAQLAPDAATAAGWGDKPPPRRTVLRRWRPLYRTTLRGFADVELPNGLQIDDIAVHVRGRRTWASLPARPMLDQDGQHVFRDGKPQRADPPLAHA
jgi:hypothetical protein